MRVPYFSRVETYFEQSKCEGEGWMGPGVIPKQIHYKL